MDTRRRTSCWQGGGSLRLSSWRPQARSARKVSASSGRAAKPRSPTPCSTSSTSTRYSGGLPEPPGSPTRGGGSIAVLEVVPGIGLLPGLAGGEDSDPGRSVKDPGGDGLVGHLVCRDHLAAATGVEQKEDPGVDPRQRLAELVQGEAPPRGEEGVGPVRVADPVPGEKDHQQVAGAQPPAGLVES